MGLGAPSLLGAATSSTEPLTIPSGRATLPMELRVPTKLGFKNPKHVVAMAVLNNYTGGYWEDQGYNWFSGL
jgi:DMSO/TMAO reductase YedYZ molybdopterin-dependent catalytic subunit